MKSTALISCLLLSLDAFAQTYPPPPLQVPPPPPPYLSQPPPRPAQLRESGYRKITAGALLFSFGLVAGATGAALAATSGVHCYDTYDYYYSYRNTHCTVDREGQLAAGAVFGLASLAMVPTGVAMMIVGRAQEAKARRLELALRPMLNGGAAQIAVSW